MVQVEILNERKTIFHFRRTLFVMSKVNIIGRGAQDSDGTARKGTSFQPVRWDAVGWCWFSLIRSRTSIKIMKKRIFRFMRLLNRFGKVSEKSEMSVRFGRKQWNRKSVYLHKFRDVPQANAEPLHCRFSLGAYFYRHFCAKLIQSLFSVWCVVLLRFLSVEISCFCFTCEEAMGVRRVRYNSPSGT